MNTIRDYINYANLVLFKCLIWSTGLAIGTFVFFTLVRRLLDSIPHAR